MLFLQCDAVVAWYVLWTCVHLSVCHKPVLYQMVKRRIMQRMLHNSRGTLDFWCQRSLWNANGVTPKGGAKYRWIGWWISWNH